MFSVGGKGLQPTLMGRWSPQLRGSDQWLQPVSVGVVPILGRAGGQNWAEERGRVRLAATFTTRSRPLYQATWPPLFLWWLNWRVSELTWGKETNILCLATAARQFRIGLSHFLWTRIGTFPTLLNYPWIHSVYEIGNCTPNKHWWEISGFLKTNMLYNFI